MKNTRHQAPALLLAATALMLLGGCESTGGPQNRYTGTEGADAIEAMTSNATLARDLRIVEPRSERRNERLVTEFELHNRRGNRLAIEWSVDWFNAAGMRVDTREHWSALVLGGGAFETLTITAPTPAAVSWRLDVRPANAIR